MSDQVRADYDALSEVANRFGQEADRMKQVAGRLGHGADNLHRTSWIGKGAEAFYREMETEILPAFRRLENALKEASTVTKAISKLFQDAEQEAAGVVKAVGSSSGGGAAAGAGEGAMGGLAEGLAAAFGGLGGASGGGYGGAGGEGDLSSFPGTLQGLLQNAVGGLQLQARGSIITITIQRGGAQETSGLQYGMDNPARGGEAGGGSGGGAGPATEQQPQTPTGGGGGGGSDMGMGGSPYGGGSSMQMGGAIGQPGSPVWFNAAGGGRLAVHSASVVAAGAAPPAPGGNALPGIIAQVGATAGAAVLGVVGKSLAAKASGR
jgi:WXG100 family type VII secretion target